MCLRARWYNPTDGTFLTRDPFPGFAAVPYSQHPYQYGYSNPVSNTDPRGRCTAFGDDYCHYTWEQLYAKYPYYAFRRESENNWEQKGWTPEDAEQLVQAYETFLITPDRYVFPTTQADEYLYAYAQSFANDFLGEYLIVDEGLYQRRYAELQRILELCGNNVSDAFWLKYAAIGAAALGLGYTGPMYDADQRIGGGGKGGGQTVANINNAIEEFLDNSTPGNVGKSTQYSRTGDFGQANADFDALVGSQPVKSYPGDIRSAEFDDNLTISVRPTSSGNVPTIQINIPGEPHIKVRYEP